MVEGKEPRPRRIRDLVFVLVGALITYLAQPAFERVGELRYAVPKTFKLPIAAKYDEIKELGDFKYIFVRYGDDEFLGRSSTSDTLRHEGKIQNRHCPVELSRAEGADTSVLTFMLPVHSILGTQFKLYAVPKSSDGARKMESALQDCCKDEVTITWTAVEVWFLLDKSRFAQISTVETEGGKIQNNFTASASSASMWWSHLFNTLTHWYQCSG